MKVAVTLAAVIALATAFDFPEEWEAWKVVSCICTYARRLQCKQHLFMSDATSV